MTAYTTDAPLRPEEVAEDAWDVLDDRQRLTLLTLPEDERYAAAEVRAFLNAANAREVPSGEAALLLVASMSHVLDNDAVDAVLGAAASILVKATNIAVESGESYLTVMARLAEKA